TLDTPALEAWLPRTRQPRSRTVGSTVQRVTYHYWVHIGEIISIRQVLGHPDVPEFVGDIDGEAPYRPEGCESWPRRRPWSTARSTATSRPRSPPRRGDAPRHEPSATGRPPIGSRPRSRRLDGAW